MSPDPIVPAALEPPREPVVLRYIGLNQTFVPGLPPRDLTQRDLDEAGWSLEAAAQYKDSYAVPGSVPSTPPPVRHTTRPRTEA